MKIPDDKELFDHMDRLMAEAIEIGFHRTWLGDRYKWTVGFSKQFDSDKRKLWGTGGGETVRAALWSAIEDQEVKQATMTVDAVITELTK